MEEEEEEEVMFVTLHDGRRLAYREQGVTANDRVVQKSLLVLHGTPSSRLAGMPGVSEDLLKEMGVRLVSIDRPGYGRSDKNQSQTFESFATEIAEIADLLALGEKFWLLAYSGGGSYCWAAIRYIPHRIAGVAMWAPYGNYWWKDIPRPERKICLKALNRNSARLFPIARYMPRSVVYFFTRLFSPKPTGVNKFVETLSSFLSPPDVRCLTSEFSLGLIRDVIESAKQENHGVAQDAVLDTAADWGFELPDIQKAYKGPLHIWNGDEDWLVPLHLQECIQKQLPDLVHLHPVAGEGHFSAFCYNDKIQRETLTTLFEDSGVAPADERAP